MPSAAQSRQQSLIVIVSLGLAVALWAAATIFSPLFAGTFGSLAQVIGLSVTICVGAAAYFFTIHFFGVLRLGDFLGALKTPNRNTST